MECSRNRTSDVSIAVGRCSVLRPSKKVSSLLGITVGFAFGEHASPKEIRHGTKNLAFVPRGGRLIEVDIRLVVAAEDSCESTEGVANQP